MDLVTLRVSHWVRLRRCENFARFVSQTQDLQKSDGDNNHTVALDPETQTAIFANGKADQEEITETVNHSLMNGKLEDSEEEEEDAKQCERDEGKTFMLNGTSHEDASREDAQTTDTGCGSTPLESKPFEGSTDTLTGDLAQIHSAKCTADCELDNPETLERTHLPPAEEKNLQTLINSATVSTSTTDISDSSVRRGPLLPLNSKCANGQVHRSGDNIMSLCNGTNGKLDLRLCDPLSLKQTAAQGEGFSPFSVTGISLKVESALQLCPNLSYLLCDTLVCGLNFNNFACFILQCARATATAAAQNPNHRHHKV